MRNKLKVLFLSSALALFGGLVFVPQTSAMILADAKTDICSGISTSAANGCTASGDLNKVIQTVVKIMSIIIGIVAIIMVIYGGARYIASGGDPGKVGDAKNTIIYALIGLAIAGLAQVLVQYVITNVK